MRTWRLMGGYDAETTTFSALAGTPASPFVPDFNGRLLGLRVIVSQSAASSLVEFQSFRLTCANWTPNMMEIGAVGNGLMTAPAPARPNFDYEVDQPIVAGVGIEIQGRNITAATPVTVETFILGLFDVQK